MKDLKLEEIEIDSIESFLEENKIYDKIKLIIEKLK